MGWGQWDLPIYLQSIDVILLHDSKSDDFINPALEEQ
jgi:hypothetical protein